MLYNDVDHKSSMTNYVHSLIQSIDRQRLFQYIGILGLYVFSCSFWISTAVANIGLACIGIFCIYFMIQNFNYVIKDKIFLVFITFSLYALLQTAWITSHEPQYAEKNWDGIWDWVSLWAFFGISWVLAGDEKRIHRILLCALLSFITLFFLELFVYNQVNLIKYLSQGKRIDSNILFGPNQTGKYASIVLLSTIIYCNKTLKWKSDYKSIIITLINICGIISSSALLIITQSRAAWIGLLSIGLIIVVYLTLRNKLKLKYHYKAIIIIIIVTLMLTPYTKQIKKKFYQDHHTIQKIIHLDVNNIELNSVGVRFKLIQIGLNKWKKKPFLGYGAGYEATDHISSIKYPVLSKKSHLHNDYIELLVRLGLIGIVIFLLGFLLLIKFLFEKYKSGIISHAIFLISFASIFLLVFCSFFQFRWMNTDYRFLWLFVAGIAYTNNKLQYYIK